jgi:hypothetical protein
MLRDRWLLNLILLAAAAVLAGAALLEQERTALAGRLTPLRAAQIEHVSLQRAGGPDVALARGTDGWRMLQPFTVAADAAPVERLLTLADATAYRSLPAAGMDLPRLGLAPAAIRVRLDDLELRLGTTEPVSGRRYVQIGDMIHLIDDYRLPQLLAPAETFVDRRLLPAGFSPGIGSLNGRPLAADALAALPDVVALRVQPLGEQLSGHLLTVESADGDDAARFVIADDGLRWSRLDLRLTYVLGTAPLAIPAPDARPAAAPAAVPDDVFDLLPEEALELVPATGPASDPASDPESEVPPDAFDELAPAAAGGSGELPTFKRSP